MINLILIPEEEYCRFSILYQQTKFIYFKPESIDDYSIDLLYYDTVFVTELSKDLLAFLMPSNALSTLIFESIAFPKKDFLFMKESIDFLDLSDIEAYIDYLDEALKLGINKQTLNKLKNQAQSSSSQSPLSEVSSLLFSCYFSGIVDIEKIPPMYVMYQSLAVTFDNSIKQYFNFRRYYTAQHIHNSILTFLDKVITFIKEGNELQKYVSKFYFDIIQKFAEKVSIPTLCFVLTECGNKKLSMDMLNVMILRRLATDKVLDFC